MGVVILSLLCVPTLQGGSMNSHTKQLAKQVVKDLQKYKDDNKCGDGRIAQLIGATHSNVQRWITGGGLPSPLSMQRCYDAKLTKVRLPEVIKQQAITTVLESVDSDNKIPRMYKKRVSVPPIIANQIKLIIDDHLSSLDQPKTYAHFSDDRDELIRKVYYLCRQG